MQKNNKDIYDAIIIGAGISGLVCGCYLAKAGMKVLILEQHHKPGGYCTSFKRKGFTFDAAAHSFGGYREGGHVRKILTEIGIDEIIKIKRYNPSDIIITPDFNITFCSNVKDTIDNLISLFPKEKNNIINFFEFLTSNKKFEFVKLKDKTFDALLRSFFNDYKLINSLAFPVFGNGGLPPSLMHAFSGSKIFSEFIIDGGYYPIGGIQNLPNALAQIIEENNGKILFRRLAKKIIQKNHSVSGVKLDNNDIINSKYVISACDMTQTFRTFLGEKITGKKIIKKIHNMTPSLSTFILYIGIDKSFRGLPPPGTNTWYLPHYDLDEIYYQIRKCNLSKAGMYMLRVCPDKKTLLAFINAPFNTKLFWRQNKIKMKEDLLNRICKLIPDIRKHTVFLDAATPHTLHKYTLNYNGAAYGWAQIPSQLFDPNFQQKSFIKRLYFTGHWITQAAGIPGVVYLGYNTANLILKREKTI
jgi:prolycopene isomerase